MIVMLKYCGGCNPHFDRAAIVSKLSDNFPAVHFLNYDNNLLCDMLLVINGCQSQCAYFEHAIGTAVYVMYKQEQYLELFSVISKLKRG